MAKLTEYDGIAVGQVWRTKQGQFTVESIEKRRVKGHRQFRNIFVVLSTGVVVPLRDFRRRFTRDGW